MRRLSIAAFCLTAGLLGLTAQSSGTLTIYYIDTEGGQSTLFIGPGGESLLVDTGNAGDRDLGRIVETLNGAGVTRIDHLWTTHYHGDHVGALLALARQVPVMRFYDHGAPNTNDRIVAPAFLPAYEALSRGKRTTVKPGDKVPMAGLDITTVASANRYLRSTLPGGGRNPSCTGVQPKDESAYIDADNGDSAGFVLAYGRFRTIDLGDLTWNGELDLMCPTNRIGPVDLYLTSHHGLERSGSPALVHALQPRVAVMNNGTRKGGAPGAFRVLHESPGLEDLWQLHWSHNVGLDNAPALFIANVEDAATAASVLTAPAPAPGGRGGAPAAPHSPAYSLKVSARPDGTFTVTNTRNGFSKTYRRR
ncbi:MAG TPA: MBL fold metallo-hydrolase [Vicinamibacterales bacterium]|jgi:beta-lactamase superfamily II metal-dependent hydrolase|nr:MBL fold metallo-hydrolase [Vicinamibacterales bacterium]